MEQHLLFKAGDQTFGLPITKTDKIIALENITVIPDVSSYIVGVQEIEGEVTVIIDLTDRFYSQSTPNKEEAEIILVEWKETKIGLLVDEVSSVQAYDTSDLRDKESEKVDGLSTSYITAFVQTIEGIIPILDPHTLFTEDKADEMRGLVEIHAIKA